MPRRPLVARLVESVAEGAITVLAAAAYRPGGALLVCGAVVVAGGVGGTALVLGGGAPAQLTAQYRGTATWGGGFAGRYVIRNGGESAVSGWKLTFTLPEGARVSSLSNARYTVAAGRVTAVPYRTGAELGPGRSVTLALKARSSSGARITGCSLNGAPCTIGVIPAPSRRPTASPSHSAKPSPTARTHSARPTPTHSTARPKPAPVAFAPYVDTSLSPAFDLVGAARRTGVKSYILAFVKPDGGCTPRWGGSTLDRDPVAAKIGDLRAVGGDVRVSFGGQSGNELARECSTVAQLTSAYAKVIGRYKLTKVDFDIEGDALADGASNDRRNRAIAALQKSHPRLDISFTLPSLPRGLTAGGLSLLRNARSHGVHIGAVNAMAMNYGSSPAPHPDGRMGDYAIDAAQAAQAQLKGIIGGSDAAAWSRIAITPMIGVNDIEQEVFTVADAAKVGAFAKSKGMAWVSMWSAARDKACSNGSGGPASATCSGVDQSANTFTKTFGSHTG